jgi:hypothetical protein
MRMRVSILGAALLVAAGASAADTSAAQKEITGLEAALGRAMIERNIAILSNIVADDWTAQNDSGVTTTKAGFIHDVQSATLVVTRFELHDVHVRVLGKVAIVQGSDDEESSYLGKVGSGTYNWMDVWEFRNGHWVSIASQLTKVVAGK